MLKLFLIIWFLELIQGMILLYNDSNKESEPTIAIKVVSHIIGSAIHSAFNAAIIGYFIDLW